MALDAIKIQTDGINPQAEQEESMTQIVTDRADSGVAPADPTDATTPTAPPADNSAIDSILEDELVEDVSIDGMCGVY